MDNACQQFFGAALRRDLTDDTAWYLVDLLREMNGDQLPDGTGWPDSFMRRHASEAEPIGEVSNG